MTFEGPAGPSRRLRARSRTARFLGLNIAGAVSIAVSFTAVRQRSQGCGCKPTAKVWTPATLAEHCRGDLESALATEGPMTATTTATSVDAGGPG
jgi:hypothetical protein